MTDKRKGIVDPWRHVEPLRTPARAPTTDKKDAPSGDAFDEAFEHPGRFTLHSEHASILVEHAHVETPSDALDILAKCILELQCISKTLTTQFAVDGIGVRSFQHVWNRPNDPDHTSKLENAKSTIWFENTSVERGMLALVRALRTSIAAKTIKKWGVTPMLK